MIEWKSFYGGRFHRAQAGRVTLEVCVVGAPISPCAWSAEVIRARGDAGIARVRLSGRAGSVEEAKAEAEKVSDAVESAHAYLVDGLPMA